MGLISNIDRFSIKENPVGDDYVLGTDSENNGTTVNFKISSFTGEGDNVEDDNKAVQINFGFAASNTLLAVVNAINNMTVNVEVDFDEIPYAVGIVPDDTESSVSYRKVYVIKNKGKGIYGAGGNITVNSIDLLLISEHQIGDFPEPMDNDPSAILQDLGEIGTSNLEDVVNSSVPALVIGDENWYFEFTRSNRRFLYGYTGSSGIYGTGQSQSASTDFFLIYDQSFISTGFVPLSGTGDSPISGDVEILGEANDLRIFSSYDAYDGSGSLFFGDGLMSLNSSNDDLGSTSSIVSGSNYIDLQISENNTRVNIDDTNEEINFTAGRQTTVIGSFGVTDSINLGGSKLDHNGQITAPSANLFEFNGNLKFGVNATETAIIKADNITEDRNLQMPNEEGTLALSVNGELADSNGNIVLTLTEGASAYDIARANGFTRSETAWLASLEGASAYAVALNNGFTGSEQEWVDSLQQTGLKAIDEGNGVGWRLANRDANLYDNIGDNAIDLSISTSSATNKGAVGTLSFAQGEEIHASGYNAVGFGFNHTITGTLSTAFGYENTLGGYGGFATGKQNIINSEYGTAIGSYIELTEGGYNSGIGLSLLVKSTSTTVVGQANEDYTGTSGNINVSDSPMFVVGNGTIFPETNTANVRSNAFVVKLSGEVTAPSLTNTIIDADTTNKVLINKEWITANFTPLNVSSISTFADDAAADTGGLITGDIYVTPTGELRAKV